MGTINCGTMNATNATITNDLNAENLALTDGRLDLPVWTTGTRPSSPVVGTVGYNSSDDMDKVEYWTGAKDIGGSQSGGRSTRTHSSGWASTRSSRTASSRT